MDRNTRIRGGSSLWAEDSPASTIITNEFFGAPKQLWIKVSGVWRRCVAWIKVSGVWKEATLYFKQSGNWD